jgi:hypothetical protein
MHIDKKKEHANVKGGRGRTFKIQHPTFFNAEWHQHDMCSWWAWTYMNVKRVWGIDHHWDSDCTRINGGSWVRSNIMMGGEIQMIMTCKNIMPTPNPLTWEWTWGIETTWPNKTFGNILHPNPQPPKLENGPLNLTVNLSNRNHSAIFCSIPCIRSSIQ